MKIDANITGATGTVGLFVMEHPGSSAIALRTLLQNSADPVLSVGTEDFSETIGPVLTSGSWSGTASFNHNPENLTLIFSYTSGVRDAKVTVISSDPDATFDAVTATPLFLDIRSFSATRASFEAASIGATVARDSHASVSAAQGLVGFMKLGDTLGTSTASLTYDGPRSGSAPHTFFNEPAGTFAFHFDAISAGVFATQPFVLVADLPA